MKAESWIDITKPIRRPPYTGEHDGVSFDEAVARITALVAVADGSGDSTHLIAHLRQLVPCLAMGRSIHSVSPLRHEAVTGSGAMKLMELLTKGKKQ